MSEANKAIIQQIAKEIGQRNLGALQEHPALHSLVPIITEIYRALSNPHMEVGEVIAEGDWVAFRLTFTGIMIGHYQGKAATNEETVVESLHMCKIVDGKVISRHSQAGRIVHS